MVRLELPGLLQAWLYTVVSDRTVEGVKCAIIIVHALQYTCTGIDALTNHSAEDQIPVVPHVVAYVNFGGLCLLD